MGPPRTWQRLTGLGRLWPLLVALGLLALVALGDRPPTPRSTETPAHEFSETRARPALLHLAENIGERRMSSPGALAAADYIEAALRRIPRLEVDVASTLVKSTDVWESAPFIARVRNVVARLPGEGPEAILVSAHYDTKPLTPGAADNALAVAAALETARVLSARPPLRKTVIFNFNSGEEVGLFGAMAFAQHRWRASVQAFVNLDAAGSAGKAILFRATEAKGTLLDAYREVPYPYATSVGEDIFGLGLVPSDSDFRVYQDRVNLPGLDFALFQDGYAYHTPLDRASRITPGSLQQVGDNTLSIVSALADRDLTNVAPGHFVYHDVLGRVFLAYSGRTARVLAIAGALLCAWALGFALRRRALSATEAIAGFGTAALAILAAVLASIAVAAGLSYGLGRPHGWYSLPAVGIAGFAAIACLGLLAVHAALARWGKASPEARFFGTWLGALVVWTTFLLLASFADLGVSYLLVWWVLPAALGLSVALVVPRWRVTALIGSSVPGALVAFEVAYRLLVLAVPLSGRSSLPVPFDLVVALLTSLPVALFGSAAVCSFHLHGEFRRSAALAGVTGLLLLAVTAVHFPYTPERPKRIHITRTETDSDARLAFQSGDFLPIADGLSPTIPGLAAATGEDGRELQMTVDRREGARAKFDVVPSPEPAQPGSQGRNVLLKVAVPAASLVTLEIPRDKLVAWSHPSPLPAPERAEPNVTLRLQVPEESVEIQLTLSDADQVPVRVIEEHYTAEPRATAIDRLAPWMTPFSARIIRETTWYL